jgi:hypothetical protein
MSARIGATLLALLIACVVLGQAGLLRGTLGASGDPAQAQDLVSTVLLGFFSAPLWVGLLVLLRHSRAAFGAAARGSLHLLAALPPLLALVALVLERAA